MLPESSAAVCARASAGVGGAAGSAVKSPSQAEGRQQPTDLKNIFMAIRLMKNKTKLNLGPIA